MNFTGLTNRFFTTIESGTFVFENIKVSATETISGTSSSGQEFRIGLTGSSANTAWYFSFKNGKLYDPEGRFFWSYNDLDINTISGEFISNEYNYYLNDELVCAKGIRAGVINGWFAQCISGATAEGTIKIKSATIPVSLTMQSSFYLSGLWTGLFTNNYHNTITLRSGQLFLPDSAYFNISGTGLDFCSGNNTIETSSSKTVSIAHTGSQNETGIFTLGLRVYADFGYKDFYITGSGLNTTNSFVGNSFTPEIQQNITAASGETGDYTWYFSTNYLDSDNVDQAKPFYAELSYVSGATGTFSQLSGITITNGGNYSSAPSVYVGPTGGGYPYASGLSLLDGTSITGVTWSNSLVGFYTGNTASYSVSTNGGVGAGLVATPVFYSSYLKSISGNFDLITGSYEYGNSGVSCSEVYNRISGSGNLNANQDVLMIKTNYIASPDEGIIKFCIKASGLEDTINRISIYSGLGLAYKA